MLQTDSAADAHEETVFLGGSPQAAGRHAKLGGGFLNGDELRHQFGAGSRGGMLPES